MVSLATSSSFVAAGDTVNITAQYKVTAPETATETGLGLRIHFNSSLLTPNNISLYPNALQPYGPLTDDTEDLDNDPLTDRFFVIGWVDFDAQWPGTGLLPLPLLDIQFDINNNLSTSTTVNISASATAKNTNFQSTSLQLCRKPSVSVTTNTPLVDENGTASVTPTFTFQTDQQIPAGCNDLVINYTVTGSATSGNDFTPLSQTVTIPAGQRTTQLTVTIIDDDSVETDETLTLSLQASDDYSLATNSASTITINSEDLSSGLPEVNLSVSKLSVTEGKGGSLLLYVTRTPDNLSQPLEVIIQLDGTANTNRDLHTFPESITIPAGKTQAHAVLVVKDDAEQEADETLNISIAASANYQRGNSSNLQLTIQDDELNQNTNLPVNAGQPSTRLSHQQVQPVPGSSQWMLLLMSFLLSSFATRRLRVRKTRQAS
ncbi:MAG: Calx-beta domain-containing protein [uncultured Thiotrichaceae bacterium]|uniref:Calx-beta domain-containing protein n=1 Tax=uncultured Thiotrichaceae bacterium TaxID=298394 RepID=A0A6S6U9C0_9GAMM|nr:MAG: Calx-beta domain-containing protein [uncultured Thiotrichaceae bacterium]